MAETTTRVVRTIVVWRLGVLCQKLTVRSSSSTTMPSTCSSIRITEVRKVISISMMASASRQKLMQRPIQQAILSPSPWIIRQRIIVIQNWIWVQRPSWWNAEPMKTTRQVQVKYRMVMNWVVPFMNRWPMSSATTCLSPWRRWIMRQIHTEHMWWTRPSRLAIVHTL